MTIVSLAGIVVLILLPVCVASGVWAVGGDTVDPHTGRRALLLILVAFGVSIWRPVAGFGQIVCAERLQMSLALPFPRSQVALGNALVGEAALPPAVVAAVYDRRAAEPPASATPTGLHLIAQGWRSSAYPGYVAHAAYPERVESISRNHSRAHDPTPTGLGRLAGLPRVGASRQPFALLSQPFQGCPEAAAIGNEIASASAFPNKIWEREDTKPRPQKTLRHPERSEANGLLSPSSLTRAQSNLARWERARFDCGSASVSGKTNALLASAQDDGFLKRALSRLSRSQVQLGNEGRFDDNRADVAHSFRL